MLPIRIHIALAACLAIGLLIAESASAQTPRVRTTRKPTPSETQNRLPAQSIQPAKNELIAPLPLTAQRLDATRGEVSDELNRQITNLKEKLKSSFPDELDALSGTGKWTPQQRNELTTALKSLDPAAVYKSWLEAEPDNTTGAERIARQTAVARSFNLLEQQGQDRQVTLSQVDELRDALAKLGQIQPPDADVKQRLETLATWTQIREILEAAQPAAAAVTQLPVGTARLIYNPSLGVGQAIVLDEKTVMVGARSASDVRIAEGNPAEALGLPVVAADPVADAEGTAYHTGSLLVNPKQSGATVRYLVNGRAYVMEPGMSQWLPPGQQWVVQFDRGGAAGNSRYALTDGTFSFNPTDRGWELYHQRFDVTIDNSRDPKDFHLTADGERMVVRGGETALLRSLYPIEVYYDRGDDAAAAHKTLNQSGVVEVAVNARDNRWDLFPEEGNKKHAIDAVVRP